MRPFMHIRKGRVVSLGNGTIDGSTFWTRATKSSGRWRITSSEIRQRSSRTIICETTSAWIPWRSSSSCIGSRRRSICKSRIRICPVSRPCSRSFPMSRSASIHPDPLRNRPNSRLPNHRKRRSVPETWHGSPAYHPSQLSMIHRFLGGELIGPPDAVITGLSGLENAGPAILRIWHRIDF